MIEDNSIPEFNLASLRDQIALVDQDPAVFSGTIYNNIKDGYKGPELTEDEMRGKCVKAAKAADAWSFIDLLPNGMDTWLGEPSGTKLSGGQKQRLCLARALVRDPALLVLDEATSALDTISESAILSSLGKSRSMGHRTTVMIAHRLASVRSADAIMVMGKGQILEQGNHDSLMAREDGAYRKLIESQKISSDNDFEYSTSEKSRLAVEDDDDEKVEEVPGALTPAILDDEKPEKQYSTGTILKRCIILSNSRLPFTCLALLGSLITGGLILGESVIFGHLVSLLNGDNPSGQVNLFSLMFVVVACAALIGYVTIGSCFGIVSEHLIMRTRDISLRSILRQDMDWFLKPGRSTFALTAVISMDAGNLSGLTGVIIGTIVSALVSVIGGAILAHIVAWKIAVVLFATSPIVILAGFFRLRVLAKVEENNQHAYIEAASLASEACSNIRTIAALGIEAETSERFHKAVENNKKQVFTQTALGNLLLAFALSITYLKPPPMAGVHADRIDSYYVYSLAYWWGAKQVREGRYTSEQFFIVLPAILFSAQAAGQIFSLAPDIGRARGAAARVFTLHDQKPSIDTQSKTATTDRCQSENNGEKGNIRFENVNLAYKSRQDTPIFKDLNLNIKAGETVALVGRSGAGKTSAISLIERFYDPTAGTIHLDGVDIKSIPVSEHRARISLVSQNPDLFSGSIAFNVGLGARPGHLATREEIVAACKAVGIHEFIEGLADGYET
jgi:ABC-type multidrug transport system fused ATPase/permease subunit